MCLFFGWVFLTFTVVCGGVSVAYLTNRRWGFGIYDAGLAAFTGWLAWVAFQRNQG